MNSKEAVEVESPAIPRFQSAPEKLNVKKSEMTAPTFLENQPLRLVHRKELA